MNIDMILAWPDNCDYPLWREYIRKDRIHFNKVIIVFTKTNSGADYSTFVRDVMVDDDITFIDSPIIESGQDWRNVAVNTALRYSTAEWVYFTEQDFFPTGFLTGYFALFFGTHYECAGVFDETRLHPCCIFAKRTLIDKTDRDFGIKAGVYDHFGKFQIDVEGLIGREWIGKFSPNKYIHYNGYSHNWRLITENQQPNYNPDFFKESIEKAMSCSVPLSTQWVKTASNYLDSKI